MELIKTINWNGRWYYTVISNGEIEYEIKSVKKLILKDIEQKAKELDDIPSQEELEAEEKAIFIKKSLEELADKNPLKIDETIKEWVERVDTSSLTSTSAERSN